MNYFTQKKLPWLFTGILMLFNTSLLTTLWLRPGSAYSSGSGKAGFTYLKTKLKLTDAQQLQFDQERKAYKMQVKDLHRKARAARSGMEALLPSEPAQAAHMAVFADQIGAAQAGIEKATFSHFRALRAKLDPKQAKKFDKIIKEVMQEGFTAPA